MKSNKRPAAINIATSMSANKIEDPFITNETPLSPTKKRKNKFQTIKKTNEEIIQESHDELLNYINVVSEKVQDILGKHQSTFLSAYKGHIKRVRDQMEQIRKKSTNNANSEKVYIEKIDTLQKQLIIFREESLRLFDKIIKKDKQIELINFQLKQKNQDMRYMEQTIQNLTKKVKHFEVLEQNFKNNKPKNHLEMMQNLHLDSKQKPKSSTFNVRQGSVRPYTTVLNLESQFKESLPFESKKDISMQISRDVFHTIKEKIKTRANSENIIKIDEVLQILSNYQASSHKNQSIETKKQRHSFRLINHNKDIRTKLFQKEYLERMKSKTLSENTEMNDFLKKCIEEVKKQIVRRNNIPSLNFFRENGPSSFIQFKKIDYFALLEMILANQHLLRIFYRQIMQRDDK